MTVKGEGTVKVELTMKIEVTVKAEVTEGEGDPVKVEVTKG